MSRVFLTAIGLVVQTDDGRLVGEDGHELDDEHWQIADASIQAGMTIEHQDEIAEANDVHIPPETREYADFLGREYGIDQDEVFVNFLKKPDLTDRDTRLSQLAGMVEEAQDRADGWSDMEDYLDPIDERLGNPRDQAERREDLAHELRTEMEDSEEWGRDEEANWRDREG